MINIDVATTDDIHSYLDFMGKEKAFSSWLSYVERCAYVEELISDPAAAILVHWNDREDVDCIGWWKAKETIAYMECLHCATTVSQYLQMKLLTTMLGQLEAAAVTAGLKKIVIASSNLEYALLRLGYKKQGTTALNGKTVYEKELI